MDEIRPSEEVSASAPMPEKELLKPEMAFLSENPEAYGLIPDAQPLAAHHLLVAANGHSPEGGMGSPLYETAGTGVGDLEQNLYRSILPHTEECAHLLRAAFGDRCDRREHPVARYSAALAEAVAFRYLQNTDSSSFYAHTCAVLSHEVSTALKRLRDVLGSARESEAFDDVFFTVSMGICRVDELGGGRYALDLFMAGDFRLYLLDENGMAPLWCTPTPVFSYNSEEPFSGRRMEIHHPKPFALLLLSESICALNAAEYRAASERQAWVWRYRMRLEDYCMRLLTDCIREAEFGERAARFFTGRTHGRESASGAITFLLGGSSYEFFRSGCQSRLGVLEKAAALMPNGFDPMDAVPPPSRMDVEMTYLRRLLEQTPGLSDRLDAALRAMILEQIAHGERSTPPPPEDVPEYRRPVLEETLEVFRRYDRENAGDHACISENRHALRESLSDHWITLRPYLLDTPMAEEDDSRLRHRTMGNRIYEICLDMNRRLSEMLTAREQHLQEIRTVLEDSLEILDTRGNDWVCGRAGTDSSDAWIDGLHQKLPPLLGHLQIEWKEDTQQYRSLLAAYMAERERLFRMDIHPELGDFAASWQGIREGTLSEEVWEGFNRRLEADPTVAGFTELLGTLRRISLGTGALQKRIRARAAESRAARDLAGRPDLRVAALRGAAYEDRAWGSGVIAVMDTATRNDFRATVRRWKENCELFDLQSQAFGIYRSMYEAYIGSGGE